MTTRAGSERAPRHARRERGDRRDRDDAARSRPEMVEARLEQLLDQARQGCGRALHQPQTAVLAGERSALEEVAHELLDEERVAS